jgi:hypothetical protein
MSHFQGYYLAISVFQTIVSLNFILSIKRCFFSEKTKDVRDLIKDILDLTLNFRFQILNGIWIKNEKTNEYEHMAFKTLKHTHNKFKTRAAFLFRGSWYNFYYLQEPLKFQLLLCCLSVEKARGKWL